MKTSEMTAKQLEAEIKRKVEVDNKNALDALRTKQQEELRNLRAALAKKKRQEFSALVDELGKYLISKFDIEGCHNPDMSADDYKEWLDELIVYASEQSKVRQQ